MASGRGRLELISTDIVNYCLIHTRVVGLFSCPMTCSAGDVEEQDTMGEVMSEVMDRVAHVTSIKCTPYTHHLSNTIRRAT